MLYASVLRRHGSTTIPVRSAKGGPIIRWYSHGAVSLFATGGSETLWCIALYASAPEGRKVAERLIAERDTPFLKSKTRRPA